MVVLVVTDGHPRSFKRGQRSPRADDHETSLHGPFNFVEESSAADKEHKIEMSLLSYTQKAIYKLPSSCVSKRIFVRNWFKKPPPAREAVPEFCFPEILNVSRGEAEENIVHDLGQLVESCSEWDKSNPEWKFQQGYARFISKTFSRNIGWKAIQAKRPEL